MKTTLEHWVEWKEKCDLHRCSEETQAALLSYAGNRLGDLVGWACATLAHPVINTHELSPWRAWEMFDGYFIERGNNTGKCYKDHLFLKACHSSGVRVGEIERLAYWMLRDVVKDFIRHHYPRRDTDSLQEPMKLSDPSSPLKIDSVEAEAESPYDAADEADAVRVAPSYASEFFGRLDTRERILLVALGFDLPISCAEVLRAAECQKSTLCAARLGLGQRLSAWLTREKSEDGMRVRALVLQALVQLSTEWAAKEICCEPIFRLMEDRRAEEDLLCL